MSITFVPWLLAAATAVWFGFMARRAGRSVVLWAVSGGLFALVTATIVWGVGHAMAIPFSEAERNANHVKWTLIAIVLIGVLGWLFTGGLHRQLLSLLRNRNNRASSTKAQPPAKTTPPAEPAKPAGKKT